MISSPSTTFTCRRWTKGSYADIDDYTEIVNRQLPIFVCKPPPDGSSPFLKLPTELRLQIYDCLTKQNSRPTPPSSTKPATLQPDSDGRVYADLYRSPGRLTKHNQLLSKDAMPLLQVSHQTRAELLKSFFGNRIWVLEASLYNIDISGLSVFPSDLKPSPFVRRLLILTVLQANSFSSRSIADLSPLKQMTHLQEVRIIFAIQGKWDTESEQTVIQGPSPKDVIQAVLEHIPSSAEVHLGADEGLKGELLSQLGSGVSYLFREGETYAMVEALRSELPTLRRRQGLYSGERATDQVD
jgi:hypothetical protein